MTRIAERHRLGILAIQRSVGGTSLSRIAYRPRKLGAGTPFGDREWGWTMLPGGPTARGSIATMAATLVTGLLMLGLTQSGSGAVSSDPHASSSCTGTAPSGSVVGIASTKDDGGYWIATNYGAVIACGNAPDLGDADFDHNSPIVGFAPTPGDDGYYLIAADGGTYAFGAAQFYGSMAGKPLNRPIVGIAVDPATGGYWMFGADGGIFAFNAPFFGSTGSLRLNEPIVGMAASGRGTGYWMVASDGGIFAYNAPFLGSTGSIHLNKPVVGMAADQATDGYWLVASDGGIFAYGAPFLGSTGSITLNRPITAMDAASNGTGYRFVASDGGVFSYGLPFWGSAVIPPAATQPPGSAPTCSLSVSSANPQGWMGETVVIRSNVPNYPVLLGKQWTAPPAYDGGFSTDATGQATLKINIETAPIGAPATIAVAVGSASCFATFTLS